MLGLLACVWLCGCEDAPPEVDASFANDLHDVVDALSSKDAEAEAARDLADPAPAHGTRCGDAVCFGEANQYCHTSDEGATGICVTRSVPSPGYYGCDGPEDCGSGACCYLGSASTCGAFGFCVSGTTVGEFMCHGDAECGGSSRCCNKGTTGSYRTCVDGLQPADPCPPPPS